MPTLLIVKASRQIYFTLSTHQGEIRLDKTTAREKLRTRMNDENTL